MAIVVALTSDNARAELLEAVDMIYNQITGWGEAYVGFAPFLDRLRALMYMFAATPFYRGTDIKNTTAITKDDGGRYLRNGINSSPWAANIFASINIVRAGELEAWDDI